jgi:hypothetical protein
MGMGKGSFWLWVLTILKEAVPGVVLLLLLCSSSLNAFTRSNELLLHIVNVSDTLGINAGLSLSIIFQESRGHSFAVPERWRFRRTVVGNEGLGIGRQLITGKQGRSAISSGLKCGQQGGGLFLAAIMGEMMDHTQMTGQSDSPPYPGIPYRAGIVWLQVLVFF